MGRSARRWALLAAAAAVALGAAVVAVTLAGSGERPPPQGISVELDRAVARPGAIVRLRVLAPEDAPIEETIYGLDAVLERRAAGGGWTPTHNLSFGLWEGPPGFARYDPNQPVLSIGLFGNEWRALRIPDDATTGRYRIVKGVGTRGARCSVGLTIL